MRDIMNENMIKLLEASKAARENRKALGLSVYKNPMEKHKEEPLSLRKAINAKCFECVGLDGDPNYRESIRTCTGYSCPLFSVRPYMP